MALLIYSSADAEGSGRHAESIAFTDVADEAGVTDYFESHGRGVAWGDYDGDGYQDIYLVNHGPYLSDLGTANLLYHNNGDGTFDDVAPKLGLADIYRGVGATWGDYDNDGDLDLYLSNALSANKLFRNKGDGSFDDATDQSGVGDPGKSIGVTWVDFDNDGNLDLFVSNNSSANRLYCSVGEGIFIDMATDTGIANPTDVNIGCAWGDYDNDDDLDLYLVDNMGYNRLYRNDGNGVFSDVGDQAGVDNINSGRGAAWGDYDNDGRLDLYATNRYENALYRNKGDGTFADVTIAAGVMDYYGDFCDMSLGCAWGDCDNDGDLDLYVTNDKGPNRLYRNNGDGTFTDVGGSTDTDELGNGVGCAWADYDRDGDLDLYLANREGPNHLYRNEGNDNNWIILKLTGVTVNRAAIGAFVRIVSGDLVQVRQVSGGEGYCSQNMLPVHFGLGDHDTVDTLVVRWPAGPVEVWTDLQVNRYHNVIEGQASGIEGDGSGESGLPERFRLYQNYPNPFNTETAIDFSMPRDSFVSLRIYNAAGRLVRTLRHDRHAAGYHRVRWDGRDEAGAEAGSGVYFYRIKAEEFTGTRRMVLLR